MSDVFLDPPWPEPPNPDDGRGEDEWAAEHCCPECGDTIRCDDEDCGCQTMAECRCDEVAILRQELRRAYEMIAGLEQELKEVRRLERAYREGEP